MLSRSSLGATKWESRQKDRVPYRRIKPLARYPIFFDLKRSLEFNYVLSLGTLLTFLNVELNFLSFIKGFVASILYSREMYEYILASIVRGNKSKPCVIARFFILASAIYFVIFAEQTISSPN